ncbi:hypothetical protein MTP99_018407 [Tenebrio molitor]|nr:hypothetical protein MTP99_018407 [Tenebrio molitor]
MTKLKYLEGTVFMLKLSLLYPIDTKSRLRKCLYFVWAFFYVSSFITTFIQCVVYLYKTSFDLIKEAMIIMNTVIYFSLFINFTFLFIKTGKLLELVQNINTCFADETDNKMEYITMERSSKLSDKFAYYWTCNCIVSSLMPTIFSLIGRKKDLPIVAWFPYNHQQSPWYELTYLWQVFCLTTLGTIYAVLDFVFPCIAILMSQQFKILGSNFRNNIYKALLESEVSKNAVLEFSDNLHTCSLFEYEDILVITRLPKFRRINANYFKKNVQHHQLLLKYCDDINNILSTFLMGKISAAIFNTVFMAFSLITTGEQAMIFGLATYVMSTSVELLIYTYSGQILTQSADILWTMYEAPWYLCDLHFQKMFNIVQMRVCKSVYTRAGKYFSMSASAYITFMKALGSYVALLKELTEREK